ncbi:MAG: pilus assembly protein PilM [bacterium]|nr:pilus assembly protein PilM [bacterium]
MNGLLPWTKEKTPPADSQEGQADDSQSSRLKISRVFPRKQYSLGRHLAFCVEEESIQMAAASQYGPKIVLHNVRKAYIPSAAKQDSEREGIVLAAINEFVREFGGRNPVISLTLAGPETALRTITMPELKSGELISALGFEAKQQIPFPIEDCHYDYRAIERIDAEDGKRLNISVLAATRRLVQEQLTPMVELGLEPAYVYHTQDVIGQLLRSLPFYDDGTAYALINVKRQRAEISFHRGANLEFLHVSSLGSSFLANRTDPTMFEYFAESLATEIQNSLDYYTGQYSSHFSNQIFIYGDLSYTDDLIDMLSDRFGFEFRRFPAESLDFVSEKELEYKDSLSVCLPVLAASVNRAKLANLLPTERKEKRRRQKADRLGVSALIVLGCLLATLWLGSVASTNASRNRLSQLERRVSEFKSTEMYATYNRLKREIARSQAFISLTSEEPSYMGLNLKELSRITPSSVRLYSLDYRAETEGRNFTLAGVIAAGDTPPELVLAEFIENLTASPFYENVNVEQHVKKRDKGRFKLEFSLSMEGII